MNSSSWTPDWTQMKEFSLAGALCFLSEESVVCLIHSHVCISKRISLKPSWILIVLVEIDAPEWIQTFLCSGPISASLKHTEQSEHRTDLVKHDLQWFLCVYGTISDDHLSNFNSLRNQIQNDGIIRQTGTDSMHPSVLLYTSNTSTFILSQWPGSFFRFNIHLNCFHNPSDVRSRRNKWVTEMCSCVIKTHTGTNMLWYLQCRKRLRC